VAEHEGLVAELWYAEAPDLADPLLLEGLRAVSPGTEAQDGSLVVPYDGGETPVRPTGEANGRPARPLLTLVLPGSSLDEPGKALPDTSQTWDWPDADTALAGARASLLVVETSGESYATRDRVAALVGVVRALSVSTQPVAVSWPTSQRVSDPADGGADGLGGLLNVRFFTVADDEDERVMDTRGLAPFGLPDVQIHFRDLDPGRLAGLLYATAAYLLEEGDVVEDGNTISGLDPDDHWPCHHEDALVAPPRRVLDVDPGDPYAAGRRAR
jgi:hypothetical protein